MRLGAVSVPFLCFGLVLTRARRRSLSFAAKGSAVTTLLPLPGHDFGSKWPWLCENARSDITAYASCAVDHSISPDLCANLRLPLQPTGDHEQAYSHCRGPGGQSFYPARCSEHCRLPFD